MRRDEDDLQLLAEVAGVLDQVVMDAGLSSGSYLLLRALAADEDGASITDLAGRFGAEPDEVVTAAKAVFKTLDTDNSGTISAQELRASVAESSELPTSLEEIKEAIEEIDARGNEAIRAYVLDRPHSATVYGLVASMQAGRFTVEDLIEFLLEPDDDADDLGGDAA
ncbi:MAG: EF-hand domain-containing protein [Miltoncostaeaceae bacterium]